MRESTLVVRIWRLLKAIPVLKGLGYIHIGRNTNTSTTKCFLMYFFVYRILFVYMYMWTPTLRNKWGFRPPLYTYRLNWARSTSYPEMNEMKLPSDTGFEIRALWGRARYLSVAEAFHNISLRVSGKETCCLSRGFTPRYAQTARDLGIAIQFNAEAPHNIQYLTTAPGPPPHILR